MTKYKRIFASVIILIMAVTLLFSAIFVIKEADHNCSGNDCPICQQISICLNSFKKISPDSTTIITTIAVVFTVIAVIGIVEYFSAKNNLVKLKIKLSN